MYNYPSSFYHLRFLTKRAKKYHSCRGETRGPALVEINDCKSFENFEFCDVIHDIHGYSWIFMDIHGYSWIFMDIHGYSWIFMDIHGYSWYTGVISRTKPENSTFFNIWGHFWALYCIEKWVLSPKLTGKLKVHLAVTSTSSKLIGWCSRQPGSFGFWKHYQSVIGLWFPVFVERFTSLLLSLSSPLYRW